MHIYWVLPAHVAVPEPGTRHAPTVEPAENELPFAALHGVDKLAAGVPALI